MNLIDKDDSLFEKKVEPLKERLDSFIHPKKTRKAKQMKEIWISVAAVAVVLGIIGLVFVTTVNNVAPIVEDIVDKIIEEKEATRHPLTGERIEDEYETLPQVFGIMVENSADSWPLAGLDEAFLVIEAPVEANIPRFIVFTSEEDEIAKIGPVRSARPYYLDWNDALDAIYGHVGGSQESLDLISNTYDTIDLDQFFASSYFYRQHTNGRYAPHNVFTSSKLLQSAYESLNLDAPNYEFWKFKDDEGATSDRSVKVDFADGTTYDVSWEFDAETNTYVRDQGTRKMILENGNQIEANNVIVIATDVRTIDAVGRKSLITVGSGDAMVAQDGEIILVRWEKEDRTGRLKFIGIDGKEVRMNPGKTWIEVVSSLSQAKSY